MHASLIIAADDYGIRDASAPILALAEEGVIDRVAVLVNFLSEEDIRALLNTPVAIDIHLELIALLGRGDSEGDSFVKRCVNFVWHWSRGDLSREAVKKEWQRQIRIFQEQFGRLPAGINSHEHVHFLPSLFRVFLEIGEEYSIGYVRFGSRRILGEKRRNMVRSIIAWLHRLDREAWRHKSLQSSEYLVSADWISDMPSFLRKLPEGRTEMVVHPERPSEAVWLRSLRRPPARS